MVSSENQISVYLVGNILLNMGISEVKYIHYGHCIIYPTAALLYPSTTSRTRVIKDLSTASFDGLTDPRTPSLKSLGQ